MQNNEEKERKKRKYIRPEDYIDHPIVGLFGNPVILQYFKGTEKKWLDFADFQYILCDKKPDNGKYEERWFSRFSQNGIKHERNPTGEEHYHTKNSKERLAQDLRQLCNFRILRKLERGKYTINPYFEPYSLPVYQANVIKSYPPDKILTSAGNLTIYGFYSKEKKEKPYVVNTADLVVDKCVDIAIELNKIKLKKFEKEKEKLLSTLSKEEKKYSYLITAYYDLSINPKYIFPGLYMEIKDKDETERINALSRLLWGSHIGRSIGGSSIVKEKIGRISSGIYEDYLTRLMKQLENTKNKKEKKSLESSIKQKKESKKIYEKIVKRHKEIKEDLEFWALKCDKDFDKLKKEKPVLANEIEVKGEKMQKLILDLLEPGLVVFPF